jgi:hypothetical protein
MFWEACGKGRSQVTHCVDGEVRPRELTVPGYNLPSRNSATLVPNFYILLVHLPQHLAIEF